MDDLRTDRAESFGETAHVLADDDGVNFAAGRRGQFARRGEHLQ